MQGAKKSRSHVLCETVMCSNADFLPDICAERTDAVRSQMHSDRILHKQCKELLTFRRGIAII